MELIRLGTGFFLKLLEGDKEVVEVWKKVIDGKLKAKTSSLVLFELKRILLKLGKSEIWNDFKEAILLNCDVVSVDISIDVFYTTDDSFKVLSKKRKPKIRIL